MYRSVWSFDDSPFIYFQKWWVGESASSGHIGTYHKRPASIKRLMRVVGRLYREGRVESRFIPAERICWDVLILPVPAGPVSG